MSMDDAGSEMLDINRVHLCDDGTLDTVFQCNECGFEWRFTETWDYRDEDTGMLDELGFIISNEWDCDC